MPETATIIEVDRDRLYRMLVEVQAVGDAMQILAGRTETVLGNLLSNAVEGFENDVLGEFEGPNDRIRLDDEARDLARRWAQAIGGGRLDYTMAGWRDA